MPEQVRLDSERLLVRDWRITETEGMHRWYGDPTVRKFLSFGSDSKAETERDLREIIVPSQLEDPRTQYFLAVELKEIGQTIGDVGFDWKGAGIAEIGYFIEPAHLCRGYATEAARLITRFAFDLGADTVVAECEEGNRASERVMQRCDMTRQPSIASGTLRYSVNRAEWN